MVIPFRWYVAAIFGTRKLESLSYRMALFVILGFKIFVELRLVTDGRTHDDSKYALAASRW